MAGNKQKYTPTEAIEAVDGLHRKKLYEMMNDRIIAYEMEDNRRLISVHELIRVFGDAFHLPETPQETKKKRSETPKKQGGNTLDTYQIQLGNKALEVENTLLKERLEELRERNQEVAEERDEWRKQAQTLLLTHQPETPTITSPPEPKEQGSTDTISVPHRGLMLLRQLAIASVFAMLTLAILHFFFPMPSVEHALNTPEKPVQDYHYFPTTTP